MEKKHILVSYPEQNYRTELKENDTMTVLNGGTVVSTHINGGKLEVEQECDRDRHQRRLLHCQTGRLGVRL